MYIVLCALFALGYAAIITEHNLGISKTATALLTGTLCWTALAIISPEGSFFSSLPLEELAARHPGVSGNALYMAFIGDELNHHLVGASQILFFLLGAMIIVELIDAHEGFELITERIGRPSPRMLMVIISALAFILSAILDNLTSAIVMVSIVRKLVPANSHRLLFASMVVVAANAGGVWSPIGDVTTTMLWIGGQLTVESMVPNLILPSIAALALPLAVVTLGLPGRLPVEPLEQTAHKPAGVTNNDRKLMFFVGVASLLFVPIFKTVTHLPPFMGMMLSLGFVWFTSEIVHKNKDEEVRDRLSASGALQRIDSSSVLFFLGILLAVGALETAGLLKLLATGLESVFPNQYAQMSAIGVLSAVVDNVPLTAATMAMYPLEGHPPDSTLWHLLAYCAGTGGSLLIIGSAAGVAVMGLEKIDFMTYLKTISWAALLGFIGGLGVFALQEAIF